MRGRAPVAYSSLRTCSTSASAPHASASSSARRSGSRASLGRRSRRSAAPSSASALRVLEPRVRALEHRHRLLEQRRPLLAPQHRRAPAATGPTVPGAPHRRASASSSSASAIASSRAAEPVERPRGRRAPGRRRRQHHVAVPARDVLRQLDRLGVAALGDQQLDEGATASGGRRRSRRPSGRPRSSALRASSGARARSARGSGRRPCRSSRRPRTPRRRTPPAPGAAIPPPPRARPAAAA